jgi:hypothetical protein
MNNEKNLYKTPLLFEQDYNELREAIIIAQNYWGDKRNGTLDWDSYVAFRIDKLERVLHSIESTPFKELPEPPKEI